MKARAAGWAIFLFTGFLPSLGFSQTISQRPAQMASAPVSSPALLPASGKLLKTVVKQISPGQWVAICDVSISGNPRRLALKAEAFSEPSASGTERPVTSAVEFPARGGMQQVTIELQRPDRFQDDYDPKKNVINRTPVSARTNKVRVELIEPLGQGGVLQDVSHALFASQTVTAEIAWPDREVWATDYQIRKDGAQAALNLAVSRIDQGSSVSLEEARFILERLLLKDGKLGAAYVELARIAMKSNWGPEGLAQAEGYLQSALRIDAHHVNSLILRGYVYTHQGRYKLAEADFLEASKSNPKNLWLWSNWGELLAKQGKQDAAVATYLRAIANPVTGDTYDRARLDAYMKLIDLFEQRKDVNGLESMYSRRAQDYGMSSCYGVYYARFKLQRQGDATAVIELLKEMTQLQCDGTSGRDLLGMAYYVSWAKSANPGDVDLLDRARLFFPPGARLFQRLAASAHTFEAAKRLQKAGESVDQKDNRRMTALAYAIGERDLEAARRLLQIGARTTLLVGEGDFPLALMPVFSGDVDGVRLLKQSGVDYSKMSYRGTSAAEIARSSGDKRLIELVGTKGGKM